ncbi:hypothetical protein EWM64_g4395 [Hericium alpestre]|uniref:Uncharacterized protein n=1 Tax=Hericium alpestre TaxID=135208 RepID=A0A4Z0A1N7_9AGAM|nr:hypothetical protein EWM64_g4395 [Hericium alpestre]
MFGVLDSFFYRRDHIWSSNLSTEGPRFRVLGSSYEYVPASPCWWPTAVFETDPLQTRHTNIAELMGKGSKALRAFINKIPDNKLEGFTESEHTIYHDRNFRLDMQGMTNTRKYNLQVQLNKQTNISTFRGYPSSTEGEGVLPAGASASETHEESVFMKSYSPRSLNEVYDPERDVDALTRGDGQTLIYADTIGLVQPSSQRAVHFDGIPEAEGSSEEEAESADGSVDGEDGQEESGDFQERAPRGHRHEDKEAKKERKKAVKAEHREKRKQKMPKAEKKKKIKNSRA